MNRKRFALVLISIYLLFLSGCQNPELLTKMEINDGWTFRQADSAEWMPAIVPGCVHTDLLRNKKIEDPFYRLKEHDVQWIDKVDWEYKTIFNVSKDVLKRDCIKLNFKGLDTYAEISVNDKLVLSADNMFREWVVDVKDLLKEGSNELHIRFKSPIIEGIKKADIDSAVVISGNDLSEIGQVEDNKKVSVYSRKAPFHFGWDWGPRLVTSGIWQPVYLKAWDNAQLLDLNITQNEVTEERAKLTANFEIESEGEKSAQIIVSCENEILATTDIELKEGKAIYPVDFQITNPKLWWTNGLGDQPLYNISGKLKLGNQSMELNHRIGIRSLKLVREKDEFGTSFYFELNGKPVFMKGANYIPSDMFQDRVTKQTYDTLIYTAVKSNMNMIRVWGGGIYENDYFYDLCDEKGILVWQDFMFACAMYPGDSAFLKNVKQEAIDNVKRLRNHPSIGLWCGNNEILTGWYNWGWKPEVEARNKELAEVMWKSYKNIFHGILPEVIENYDPERSYWPSSPSSGDTIDAVNNQGDAHYWMVWWGQEPFKDYENNIARFMSEYGFQSFPDFQSVKKYTLPEDYDIYSDVMKSHQRSSIGNETIERYMLRDYKKPKDFESFLYIGQVLQAEGIKMAIEAHRRAKPFCMGSLYWQLNDCWPVASWSSTDYYRRWKALQYFVKKGFENVLVSPFIKDGMLNVDIVNDKLSFIHGELVMRMIDFEGKEIWRKTVIADIPENSSDTYFSIRKNSFLADKNSKNQFLYVELMEAGEVIASNTFYFRPVKKLMLPTPNISAEINETEGGFEIILSSDKLAKNIFLTTGEEQGFFSDNHFDLIPNEKVKIKLETSISRDKLDEVFIIQTIESTF